MNTRDTMLLLSSSHSRFHCRQRPARRLALTIVHVVCPFFTSSFISHLSSRLKGLVIRFHALASV